MTYTINANTPDETRAQIERLVITLANRARDRQPGVSAARDSARLAGEVSALDNLALILRNLKIEAI